MTQEEKDDILKGISETFIGTKYNIEKIEFTDNVINIWTSPKKSCEYIENTITITKTGVVDITSPFTKIKYKYGK